MSSVITTQPSSSVITTTKFIGNGNGKCPNGDGYYVDYSSGCQNYYLCNFSGTSYQTVTNYSCPNGLLFDDKLKVCNWANQVSCTP